MNSLRLIRSIQSEVPIAFSGTCRAIFHRHDITTQPKQQWQPICIRPRAAQIIVHRTNYTCFTWSPQLRLASTMEFISNRGREIEGDAWMSIIKLWKIMKERRKKKSINTPFDKRHSKVCRKRTQRKKICAIVFAALNWVRARLGNLVQLISLIWRRLFENFLTVPA